MAAGGSVAKAVGMGTPWLQGGPEGPGEAMYIHVREAETLARVCAAEGWALEEQWSLRMGQAIRHE